MRDVDAENDIHAWEKKAIAALLALLTTVFGIWAGVVWRATDKVMDRIDLIATQINEDRIEQQQYRSLVERRLTIQEQQLAITRQRQEYVLEALRQIDHDKVPP